MLKNLAPDDFDPSDYLREQAENMAINSLHEMNEEKPGWAIQSFVGADVKEFRQTH